jgi:hypothetical protein
VIEMIMEGDKSAISARIAGYGKNPVHELLCNTNSIDLELLLGLMLELDSDIPNKISLCLFTVCSVQDWLPHPSGCIHGA